MVPFLKSTLYVKIVAVIHAILACVIFLFEMLSNPTGFFCSSIIFIAFQLFVLSWWLWRFPPLDKLQEQVMPILLSRPHYTHEQKNRKLIMAWRLQLGFVLSWGWLSALIFWYLAIWVISQGGCSLLSVLLLGGFFTAAIGWIIGGAGILYGVFKERTPLNEAQKVGSLSFKN
jgi:hypothetical protein